MSITQFPVDKMGKTPDQRQKPDIHIVLAAAFCRECGFRYLPYMPEQFREWLLKGFDAALLFYAIEKTARAPRPSFAYLDYLINKWGKEGTKTKKAVLIEEERRKGMIERYKDSIDRTTLYPSQFSKEEMIQKMCEITEDEILGAMEDAHCNIPASEL